MGIGLFLGLVLAVWVLTEVVGKYVLKNVDKRVLAVPAALVVNLIQHFAIGGMSPAEASFWGVLEAAAAGNLHDKVIEPLLILGKKEIKQG